MELLTFIPSLILLPFTLLIYSFPYLYNHLIPNIKYYSKCGRKEATRIEIYETYIQLKIGQKCIKNILYEEIDSIEYYLFIDNPTEYNFYINLKDKSFNHPSFKLEDTKALVAMASKKNIVLYPFFMRRIGIGAVLGALNAYCAEKGKYLLRCEKNEENIQCSFNSKDGLMLQTFSMDNFNINLEKSLYALDEKFEKTSSYIPKDDKFIIFILDKSLTLGQGYAVLPLFDFNFDLLKDKIFYSYDEQEIRDEVVRLMGEESFL